MIRLKLIFVFCFVTLLAMQVNAQESTIELIDDTTAVIGGYILELEDEKEALQAALADANSFVLFYPDGRGWSVMPRADAIEMADRLIALAELEPGLLHRIASRFGIPGLMVDIALLSPESIAPQLLSALESQQRPQIDAYLAETNTMISDLTEVLSAHLNDGGVVINTGWGTDGITWTTRYGDMTFKHEGVNTIGDYNGTNAENGKLIGQMNGLVWTGVWVEDKSDQACDTLVDGRKYWGGFEFTFNAELDSFEGTWGYCKSGMPSRWYGSKKVVE